MIDLLKSNNGLILTKFLNKIWRRYSFSNLGELFITQKDLARLVPDYKFNETILDRVVEAEEEIENSEDETEDGEDDNDEKNESKSEAASSQKN